MYLSCVFFGPLLARFPRYRLHMQLFGLAAAVAGLIGSAFATKVHGESVVTPDSPLVTDPLKLVSRSAEPPTRLSRAHLPALLPLLLALRGLALCTSPIRQRCRLSTAKLLD
jgi:hypothetical protein